jgi:hypothetical protein
MTMRTSARCSCAMIKPDRIHQEVTLHMVQSGMNVYGISVEICSVAGDLAWIPAFLMISERKSICIRAYIFLQNWRLSRILS